MKFKASIKVPNEASHVVLYWIKNKKKIKLWLWYFWVSGGVRSGIAKDFNDGVFIIHG